MTWTVFQQTRYGGRKIYGRDLVKGIRTLVKLDFKHKKTILDFKLLISCKNAAFSQIFIVKSFQ